MQMRQPDHQGILQLWIGLQVRRWQEIRLRLLQVRLLGQQPDTVLNSELTSDYSDSYLL